MLIVGTGLEAHALRQHLERIRHLGYTFKGFIELPGCITASRTCRTTSSATSKLSSSTPASNSSTKSSSPPPASAASCRMSGAGARARSRSARRSRSLRWPGLEQPDRIHRPVSHHPPASRRGAGDRADFQARLRHRLFHRGAGSSFAAAAGDRHRHQVRFSRARSSTLRSASARRAWYSAASSSAPWFAMPTRAAPRSCT